MFNGISYAYALGIRKDNSGICDAKSLTLKLVITLTKH